MYYDYCLYDVVFQVALGILKDNLLLLLQFVILHEMSLTV